MKIGLKVFKYEGTLRNELSSIGQAERVAELMSERYPDLIFEPHMEPPDDCVIDLSDLETNTAEDLRLWDGRSANVTGTC